MTNYDNSAGSLAVVVVVERSKVTGSIRVMVGVRGYYCRSVGHY